MFSWTSVARVIPMAVMLSGLAGCSGVDRVSRKMEMASEHLGTTKPLYEGRLVSAKTVGALVSLQFADGQTYEVATAPSALVPGDIVRIYKTDKGYEAHLWRESKDPPVPPGTIPAVPSSHSGS